MKKVACITDSLSKDFFFPIWQRYYGSQFGMESLFVVTYRGHGAQFRGLPLGGLWEVNAPYSETLRAALISDFVAVLLRTHDVVIRCDVDEMLVPDPRAFRTLAEWVERTDATHTTAIGFEILEELPDPPLDPANPILVFQRKMALRSSFLNKTGVTRVPLRWAEGFHACSAAPQFAGLFNLHLKYADVAARVGWFKAMLGEALPGSSEEQYFRDGETRLLGHQRWYSSLPFMDEEAAFFSAAPLQAFVDSTERNPHNGIYHAPGSNANEVVLIPSAFRGML